MHLAIAGVSTVGGNGGGRLKYVISNSNSAKGLVTINEHATNSATSYGHANASSAFGVGAVNALASPPTLEPFSSAGGVCIYFNTAGQPITCDAPRQKPDVVAPDNVNTTFFGIDDYILPNDPDTFPNFIGTSAAAPHVAAVVALLKQAYPTALPSTLYTAIRSGAIDMNTPFYDNTTGFGRVDAMNAWFRNFTPSPPDLHSASDNGASNSDNLTSLASHTITGTAPAGSFVQLRRNGSQVATIQLGPGSTTYQVTPSSAAPLNAISTYEVRVKESVNTPSLYYSQLSPALTVWVDELANTTPSAAPDLTSGSDSGISATDNITFVTIPSLSGTAPAGALVTLWVDGALRNSQQLAPTATTYLLNTATALTNGARSVVVRTQKLPSAPSASFIASPALTVTIDTAPPVPTITPVSPDPRNFFVETFQINWNKAVAGFDKNDLSMTKDGGANRLPGTATMTTGVVQAFTMTHTIDITMAAGSYNLTFINYATSGVTSVAGVAPSGTPPVETWTQGNGTYQSPLRYLDVTNDTYVSAIDALNINNRINACGSHPFTDPTALACYQPLNPAYVDTNADNYLTPLDALLVYNFLNDGGYTGGPYMMSGGGNPPPIVSPEDVQVEVNLEIVDANGQQVESVSVDEQFQLRVSLLLTAPEGVQPFAGYADVLFYSELLAPVDGKADVGLQWSKILAEQIDEGGRVLYDDSSGTSSNLIFSKTFRAVKEGFAIFEANAADVYGNDILVTWLNAPLPLSQVTFGSATLEIKSKGG